MKIGFHWNKVYIDCTDGLNDSVHIRLDSGDETIRLDKEEVETFIEAVRSAKQTTEKYKWKPSKR